MYNTSVTKGNQESHGQNLLESLPDLDHRNHPELLEAYLPWSETLPESCRLREHRTNKKCMF